MERSFLEIRQFSEDINYDGSQLSPHWIYKNTGVMGDATASFVGACDIPYSNMVDLEDVLAKEQICSSRMLHFITEIFGRDCLFGSTLLSVFVSEIQNELLSKGVNVTKKGDDLFIKDGKLSIAIATATPVSTLMHIGINVTTKGTPVKTASLEEHKIDPIQFSSSVLERFNKEYSRIILAACKVVPRGKV